MPELRDAYAQIDRFAERWMTLHNVPGLSMSITDRNETLRILHRGFANMERREPIAPGTIFEAGSIGKSFTALCLPSIGGSRKSGPSPARLRLSPMVRGRRQPWHNHRPSPSHPYGGHNPRRRLRPLRPVRGLGAAKHSHRRPSRHAVQLLQRRIQGARPPAGNGRRRRLRRHHPVADTGTARHGGHPSRDHAGHTRPHGTGVLATV